MLFRIFGNHPAVKPHDFGKDIGADVKLTDLEFRRSTVAAGPEAVDRGLSLRAMGNADDDGGLWFLVRGLPAASAYQLRAWYPDGRPYTFLKSGHAARDGSAPNMRWNPYLTDDGRPDPEGVYTIALQESGGGRRVEVDFLIIYGNRWRTVVKGSYLLLRHQLQRRLSLRAKQTLRRLRRRH